jgi:uncharacterized repeat protein (TIGR03803 family)
MKRTSLLIFCSLPAVLAGASQAARAQESLVYSYESKGKGAYYAQAGVIQGADGGLYGTTMDGGLYQQGTVYRIGIDAATGAVTQSVLHSFGAGPNDGLSPAAGLIQAADGNFYGTTWAGGAYGYGTVFRIEFDVATGKANEKVLHSFNLDGRDGANPDAGLVQGSDGRLYGTTLGGGAFSDGTVFQIELEASGVAAERVMHSFNGKAKDGTAPQAGLIQASDGNFYGTTPYGGAHGANGYGTVFSMSVDAATGSATEKVLHSFGATASDGQIPAGLVQGSDGKLYGLTSFGGAYGNGTAFQVAIDGSAGPAAERILHSFGGKASDGRQPAGSLVLATNGNFYGVTSSGGADGDGTVFQLAAGGAAATEAVVYSFGASGAGDAVGPIGLVQASDANLYGASAAGGTFGYGAIFRVVP